MPDWRVADFYYGVWGDGTGRVWAVGQVWAGRKGLIVSEDFGRTWTALDRPNRFQLKGIHGDGEGHVWAVGDGGTVLRAECNGGPWKRVRTGIVGTCTGVYCRSARDVWIVTIDGVIHRSTDGGRGWAIVREKSTTLWAIAGQRQGPLYAVGADWTILHSDDGVTWTDVGRTIVAPTSQAPQQFVSVAVAPDGTVYAGGWAGQFVRSRDHGATWEPVPVVLPDPQTPVSAIAINDTGHMLATTYNSVMSSTDGDHWVVEYLNEDFNRHRWHHALWLGAAGDAVAVGYHGTVMVRQR